MEKKISFYFEKIQDLANTDNLDDLVYLHTKSYEKHGWEVIQLDESVARRHPLYDIFNDESSILNTSQNGWTYTRSCYMRWLAYASAGHFFADFDVINYGFTPQTAVEMREIAGGPTFISGATAMGLFLGRDYDRIINAFLEYKERPFIRGILETDVNDMNILIQTRSELFSLISREDVRIARDYNNPGWEVAKLVHYPYAYTKQPRSETVRRERLPSMMDESGVSEDKRSTQVSTAATGDSHGPMETWPSEMSRADVVNAVLSLFETPRYLEIGVNTGNTFFNVKAHHKVAVDPAFLFDPTEAKKNHPNGNFHSQESDPYFGSTAKADDRFDVIYLDGLHTFEQTLRDFCNAIDFLRPNGVIVIDDVVPTSYHAAIPDAEVAWHVRNALGVKDGMWMGDVYRLVLFIQTFFQQYRYATVIENHGQLVVWRSQRAAEEVVPRQVEDIARASFDKILLDPAAFNRMPFSEIMASLRRR